MSHGRSWFESVRWSALLHRLLLAIDRFRRALPKAGCSCGRRAGIQSAIQARVDLRVQNAAERCPHRGILPAANAADPAGPVMILVVHGSEVRLADSGRANHRHRRKLPLPMGAGQALADELDLRGIKSARY